ncbi:hypothetical protein [Marininema halotolerans]|uniref:Uncharacterized protein n=1 Tax=Marininema halotolerans TaxID=1155944 RepID=A0A1I6R1C4_9BACL|nr:hypothetical protein [Marininema halotolerans]SFS58465.1 hypothetical protein SAMN05444972_10419 [Marininema halotolerans]
MAIVNQTFSTRVARAEFDRNWVDRINRSGFVVYRATKRNAKVTLLLNNGRTRILTFPVGGTVLVGGGGASFYSKPHTTRII